MEIKVEMVRRDHENRPVFETFIMFESNKAFQLAKIKQSNSWNDLFQELEKIRDEVDEEL